MSRIRRRVPCWPAALLILTVGACGCSSQAPKQKAAKPAARPAASRPERPSPDRGPAPVAERPRAPANDSTHYDPTKLRLKVVGVHDGDTLTGLDAAKTQHKIRLHAIDAPELGQAHGQAAKKALSAKVFGRQVVVAPKTVDRYGRTVGQVIIDGRDVNLEMIQEGMAWHYEQYDDSPRLRDAQRAAREAGRGLWQGPEPEPPWDHRREQRDSKRAAAGK